MRLTPVEALYIAGFLASHPLRTPNSIAWAEQLTTWATEQLAAEPPVLTHSKRDLWDLSERHYSKPPAPPLLDEWMRYHEPTEEESHA